MKQFSHDSHKFNGAVMNTAYSTIGLTVINTAEHYQLASHLGFNALKGDVRVTADGKLIMCHDAGFTLDADGRITRFDRAHNLPIRTLSYDDIMSLEHAAGYETLGHRAHVCDFDTFVRICKENGMICYITARDYAIETLVKEILATLAKYRMEDRCVVNSFTLDTIKEVRKYSDTIPVSQVINHGKVLTREIVDGVIPLGNAMICSFLYPCNPEKGEPVALWEQSMDAVEYAWEHDIQIHMAQVNTFAGYSEMIRRGVQGFHLTRPILPYTRTDICFKIVMEDGKPRFENILGSDRYTAEVEAANDIVRIRNIACSGSGYGYDDGLPALWLNVLPYTMTVTCGQSPAASITYANNALTLITNGVDGEYVIHVNI